MGESSQGSGVGDKATAERRFLFVTCFVALVATSFAFIIRVMLMEDWQIEFGLSETQKGEIFGAGLWPFGLSIVLFSLVIDKVGYGKSMIFAFACHALSTALLFTAGWGIPGYWALYLGSILNGLAAGTVEAVINPAIASAYAKQKTKWLSILHAGWPGGFVLGGIMALLLGAFGVTWRPRVFLILIPVVAYGVMLLRTKFPVSERVVAGVPYKDMLKEAGALGCLIVIYMVLVEINRVLGFGLLLDTTFFDLPSWPFTALIVLASVGYFIYTRSFGQWMYVFLLFVMILLAITELGTDNWIKDLMGPAMGKIGLSGGWLLVYTATIMMVLRFLVGHVQKGLSKVSKVLGTPLGILLLSSILAMVGIYFLAWAEGAVWILLFATIYGMGQCFFWPVTIGLVAERFPKGGALTINAVAGVGMLGVGILGSQLLGFWQDTRIDRSLFERDKQAHVRLMSSEDKQSIFGAYKSLDQAKVNEINDKTNLYDYRAKAKKDGKFDDLAKDAKYRTLVRSAYNHDVQARIGAVKALVGHRERAAKSMGPAPSVDDLNAKLADDETYQGLVRNAYHFVIRGAATDQSAMQTALAEQRLLAPDAKPDDYAKQLEGEKNHEEMDKALAAANIHVGKAEYDKLLVDKRILYGKPTTKDEAGNVTEPEVVGVTTEAKRNAMARCAILPLVMALCYLGLIFYFRSKGGYKQIDLAEGEPAEAPKAEAPKAEATA